MNAFFTGEEISAIWLSFKVALGSTALIMPLAIALGLLLARRDFPGKTLFDSFLCLPLVMPPVTTGYILLVMLGRRSFIGTFCEEYLHLRLSFTIAGAIIASAVVSFPLILRAVRIAFEMADRRLEDAAATLGASPSRCFLHVTLPLALPGLINGLVLGFARSLGEFGATITFAGNLEGETRTIPLAVFSLMQTPGQENAAMKLVAVSVIIAFAAMAGSEWLNRRMRKRLGGG